MEREARTCQFFNSWEEGTVRRCMLARLWLQMYPM